MGPDPTPGGSASITISRAEWDSTQARLRDLDALEARLAVLERQAAGPSPVAAIVPTDLPAPAAPPSGEHPDEAGTERTTSRRRMLTGLAGAAAGAVVLVAADGQPAAANSHLQSFTLGDPGNTASATTGVTGTFNDRPTLKGANLGNQPGVTGVSTSGTGVSGSGIQGVSGTGSSSGTGVSGSGLVGVYGDGGGGPTGVGVRGRATTGVEGVGNTGVGAYGDSLGSGDPNTIGLRAVGYRGVVASGETIGVVADGDTVGVRGAGSIGVEGEGTTVLNNIGVNGIGETGVRGFGPIAVLAQGDSLSSGNPATTGLLAIGAIGVDTNGDDYGLVTAGVKAQMRLKPGSGSAGAPTFDAHLVGELYLDTAGALWSCVASGTPGTWRKVTAPSAAGAFHVLPAPVRIYDSRPSTTPAVGSKTPLNGNVPRTLATTANSSGVPVGATAVSVTVLLVNAFNGNGNFTLWANGAPRPSANTMVWGAGSGRYTTSSISAVDGSASIQVAASAKTDVVIDVVGYYR